MAVVGLGFGVFADILGAGRIPTADLTNYLVATGVMIGGTTAIVFSISLFLLNGVSDMYSSRHLDEYVNHPGDQLIYPVIITITLGFFAAALYITSLATMSTSLASSIVVVSLLLIGVVFGLIDRQYEAVRQKVSPARVVAFLRNKAEGFLKLTERDAAQIAGLMRGPNNEIPQDEALALTYNRVLGPMIVDLGRQAELLVDISLRLAERHEVETARVALEASGEIVAAYLQVRRTSSLAVTSNIAPLATESDSHSFLSARFEQLNRAGLTFIHAGQEDLAAEVVEVYRIVANAAKGIKPLGLTDENPVLEWVMQWLNTYVRSGLSERNIEVVFQGVGVLTEIGIGATDAGLDTLVLAVQERLSDFGSQSLAFNTTAVLARAISGLLAILAQTFRGNVASRELTAERSLRGVGRMVTTLTDALSSGVIENVIGASEALMSGYTRLQANVDDIVNHYGTLVDESEKRTYRRDLVMLFEALRHHFREMTGRAKADSLVVESIGWLIFHVNEIIIARAKSSEFGDVREDLHKALKWLCYSPYWFLHESASFDPDSGAVRTLVDGVAKTGILAWQANDEAILAACIESIDDMARAAMEKGVGSSGYAEARIVERACYLGILAMRSGWTVVVNDLKDRLTKFEGAWATRYPEIACRLPNGLNQVAIELLDWANKFDYERLNGVRIMEDAEDMMYEVTDETEIRYFVKEMWGIE